MKGIGLSLLKGITSFIKPSAFTLFHVHVRIEEWTFSHRKVSPSESTSASDPPSSSVPEVHSIPTKSVSVYKEYVILRRYSEFDYLHQQVSKVTNYPENSMKFPTFPGKNLAKQFDELALELRRK